MYMQHLKQDDSIRTAITEMQQLPESFLFNNQKVWSAIETRLPEKRKSAKKWYLAAAAILLLTVTFYFTSTTNNYKQLTQNEVQTTPVTVTTKEPAGINIRNTGSINVVTLNKKKNKKSFVPIPKSKLEKTIAPIVPQEHTIIAITESPIHTLIANDKTEKQQITASTTAIITNQPPKKYKVIHINELSSGYTIPAELKNLSKYELKKAEILESTSQPMENLTRQLFFFKKVPSVSNTTSISEN